MAMNMCKERGQKWCPYIRPGYFGRTAFLKKIFIFIYFLEKGEGREKEGERNIDWLPLACLHLGTWPETQTYALMGN